MFSWHILDFAIFWNCKNKYTSHEITISKNKMPLTCMFMKYVYVHVCLWSMITLKFYLWCLFVEHAFPNKEQAKASCSHDSVLWRSIHFTFYCCEIPNGQAIKQLVQSSVMIYLQEQRTKICNSNGCVITLFKACTCIVPVTLNIS